MNPTILVGWTKLGDFYGLTGNHQVTMTHFGQSVFFLTIFKSNYELKAYPKWHSLYYQISNSDIFKVLLNEYKVTCSSLVSKSTLYIISTKHLYLSNFKIIYISKMNLMLISRCVKYHVLIYERCKIHPSEFKRDYGMQNCL